LVRAARFDSCEEHGRESRNSVLWCACLPRLDGVSLVNWWLARRLGVLGTGSVVACDRYVAFLYGSSFPYRLTRCR
jgi:hypothetical protein